MTFAEKLRELRGIKGLSEAGLAEASGIPFGTLHFYVLGRQANARLCRKLARALGVSCDVFAECDDVTGPIKPDPPPKPTRKRKPPP